MMLTDLHAELGWEGLGDRIQINCFLKDPSIKSSLTFLRRTPWARQKVEELYVKTKGLQVKYTPTSSINVPSEPDVKQPMPDNPWLKGK